MRLSTVCVHGGRKGPGPDGALHPPLHSHSTFGFPSTKALLDVVEGRRPGSLYTRYGLNPTILAVERTLALLEGGERALVFSSGMAAEAAVLLACCRAGDRIACVGNVYGGTYELLKDNLPRLGIRTDFLREPGRPAPSTRLVFLETPTNPGMEVFDIRAAARAAHRAGALLVVDNTFASPVNQNPLALGADLVVHSATKYLGGHSDLTGGAAVGSKRLLEPVWAWRKSLGQMMAPEVAHLLARSLRTLPVRVRAQNEAARTVALFLKRHPRVLKLAYPGLPGCPGHAVAKRQMKGYGGMLSFVVKGGAKGAAAVVDRLRLFSIAPSLGGTESLATQPVTTTHHGMAPEERARRGIEDGMIRLSCGLEDPRDLVEDLKRALR